MKLDFWNNPLVVSALRVRARKGGLFRGSVIWLLLLVGMGGIMNFYREGIEPRYEVGLPWYHFYVLVLCSVQWIVCAVAASVAVAGSMIAEVSNRTLDFQRIVAMSPRRLLLGKMFGEPIQAYLLTLTALPILVWCLAWGVAGLTFPVLLLVYVNFFTTMLLFSANALVVQVELKDGKVHGGGAWLLVYCGAVLSISVAWINGAGLLTNPAICTLCALLTPTPAMLGLTRGDAFLFPAVLFGLPLPCLVLTPVCQLILAAVCFRVMERRLRHPLIPTLSKPMVYGLLVLIDVLTAGILFDSAPGSLTSMQRVVVFCGVHLLAAVSLIGMATPSRDTLLSWVWRYRARWSWWRDRGLGDRSPTELLGPICGIFGGVILALLVLWPALTLGEPDDPSTVVPMALAAWGLVALLTVSVGILIQWLTIVAKMEGGPTVVAVFALVDGMIYLGGSYFNLNELSQMSLTGNAVAWGIGQEPLNPLPLLLTYTLIAVLSWLGWQRRLRAMEAKVDAQLRFMEVVPPQ